MLHLFEHEISIEELPKQFTWPFHYTPHPLCREAAAEVEEYLRSRPDWSEEIAAGKMFGVLVVRTADNKVGFLAAFSGNLAGSNSHEYFVPAVYDMLRPDDFFRVEETEISAINRQIKELTASPEYLSAEESLRQPEQQATTQIAQMKALHAERKALRDRRRNEGVSPAL